MLFNLFSRKPERVLRSKIEAKRFVVAQLAAEPWRSQKQWVRRCSRLAQEQAALGELLKEISGKP